MSFGDKGIGKISAAKKAVGEKSCWRKKLSAKKAVGEKSFRRNFFGEN